MKKSKLLICGATGFIGRNCVEYFARQPQYEVHAVHFNRQPYFCDNVTWHHADLRDPAQVKALLTGVEVLVQAAATTSGSKDIVTKPYIHVTDNAIMNSYLFRSAYECAVKQVIFFSCTVIYQSAAHALAETDFNAADPLYPRYFGVGHTKLYLEKMCEFYASISDTRYTVIRHSNIYGPHDKFDLERSHVFGATVTKVMTADDKIVVWGTGEEERDLLYVDDLMRFIHLALQKQPGKYGLYNCGYGQAVSIKTLVNKIVTASGKKIAIEHDISKPTIKTSLFLNCKKAATELGWYPVMTLDEGIQKTIQWWQENIAELVNV